MRSLVVAAILVSSTPARAEPRPRGFVEGVASVGAMAGAPADLAGILGVGVRGGWWNAGSRVGFELAVDAAKLPSPEPCCFDSTSWRDKRIVRLRALAAVRVVGEPVGTKVYFGRLAVGVERVSISAIVADDFDGGARYEEAADTAAVVELSGGLRVGQVGAEIAGSLVRHDDAELGVYGHALDYIGVAVELRLVVGFDL